MTAQTKRELFWWYLDNTPAKEIKPMECLTIEYILRKKIGLEK